MLQRLIIRRIALRRLPLRMVAVAQHLIDVGENRGIFPKAIRVFFCLRSSRLQHSYALLHPLLFHESGTLVIIEDEHIRMVGYALMAIGDDALRVALPNECHEFQESRPEMFGLIAQDGIIDGQRSISRQLRSLYVCQAEFAQIAAFLRNLQCRMIKLQHTGSRNLQPPRHLGLRIDFEQGQLLHVLDTHVSHRLRHALLEAHGVALFGIIMQQGHLHKAIVGIRCHHLVEDSECLLPAAILHIEVAEHDAPPQFLGVFSAPAFHHPEGLLALPHAHQDAEFLHDGRFVNAFRQFQTLHGAQGSIQIRNRLIDFQQQTEVFRTRMHLRHFLIQRGSTVVFSSLHPPLCQRSAEEGVRRLQLIGAQQHLVAHCHGEAVGLRREVRGLYLSQLIESLRGIGVDVECGGEQFAGGGKIVVVLLPQGFEEELVEVALLLLREQCPRAKGALGLHNLPLALHLAGTACRGEEEEGKARPCPAGQQVIDSIQDF